MEEVFVIVKWVEADCFPDIDKNKIIKNPIILDYNNCNSPSLVPEKNRKLILKGLFILK